MAAIVILANAAKGVSMPSSPAISIAKTRRAFVILVLGLKAPHDVLLSHAPK